MENLIFCAVSMQILTETIPQCFRKKYYILFVISLDGLKKTVWNLILTNLKLLLKTNGSASVNINGLKTTNSSEEKLLCLKFGSKFSFENLVSSLCKKASQKLDGLYQDHQLYGHFQTKTILETFSISDFKYYPLVWMFKAEKLNIVISSKNERVFRVTCVKYARLKVFSNPYFPV